MNQIDTNSHIQIYTDGACSGNPGPGGWGSIVIFSNHVIELAGSEFSTTNNRMEMQAALSALVLVCEQILANTKSAQIKEIVVYTDSVYVIKGITQWVWGWKRNGWKNSSGEPVINQDLWESLLSVVNRLKIDCAVQLNWKYVRGHKGTPGNERCDRLAVAQSKNEYVHLYDGSAQDYLFDVFEAPPTEPVPESSWTKSTEKKVSWYLVLKNGVVAKYNTWSECEASVKGAPGVKFKKVSSEAEERELLKSWGKL